MLPSEYWHNACRAVEILLMEQKARTADAIDSDTDAIERTLELLWARYYRMVQLERTEASVPVKRKAIKPAVRKLAPAVRKLAEDLSAEQWVDADTGKPI